MTYNLREYQLSDVEKIRAEYRAGARSVLHVAPTGSGKTVIFCYITEAAMEKGNSVLILTHRNNLLQQTSEKLKENGIRHGIIAAGYPSVRYRVQVASIQTLVRRLDNWEHFDLIITDECHHFGSKTLLKIRDHFSKSKLYGCTATPVRLDNYGLGNNFDTMVVGASYKYLISKGFLSRPIYYIPEHIDLDDVKKSMGDYNKKQLSEKFGDDKYIIGHSINFYSKWADKKACMIFCINIDEANKTAEQFKKAGYNSVAIHSRMDYRQIRQAITDMRDGKINVITSCDMVGEGTDIPRIEAIIQLRPTMSLTINHQQNGRGLRPFPGKECSIHIDQVGNCERHGLIDWDIEWKLTKEKFVPKIAPVKMCKFCFAAFPVYMKTCPECGQMHIPKRKKELPERIDGDLKKVDYKALNEKIEKGETLDDYLRIAREMNYKDYWAHYMYNIKHGVKAV